ncbi:phosphate/phosphite/phosphonate ABC transporter substrate-binding protein [Magnetococcus sp. PR-3]|uniref:phosphate/phosphite/phosphonate ABC transporter substrate-binding protein n=1 Tax=Magnetococcus sp. PR-3 TaxID=3120355 RepID=UPI002FCE4E9F
MLLSSRFSIKPLCVALFALLFTMGPTLSLAVEPLTLGVFPRRNASVTYTLFSPLASYLETHLDRPVRLVTSKDFKSFWKHVESQKLDIVHFNQLHYLRAHTQFGYNALVMNEEFGAGTIRGALVVRRNTGIHTIDDLRGKTIIFGGGPSAMMSYVVPMNMLKNAGITSKDFNTRFAINPPNAVLSLAHHQAEAAGTGHVILDLPTVKKRIDTRRLKILAQSAPLPHLPWATRQDMPKEIRDQLRSIFTTMKQDEEGRMVLKHARVTNFISTDDQAYTVHRAIVKETLGEAH